jgi:hypothetical protein
MWACPSQPQVSITLQILGESHTNFYLVCWGFNFILSLTWPALVKAFSAQGAFGWYAAWNFFGWVYCYFLLPETKNLTLEELDTVFDVGNKQFASYYTAKLPWYFQTKVLRRDVAPMRCTSWRMRRLLDRTFRHVQMLIRVLSGMRRRALRRGYRSVRVEGWSTVLR